MSRSFFCKQPVLRWLIPSVLGMLAAAGTGSLSAQNAPPPPPQGQGAVPAAAQNTPPAPAVAETPAAEPVDPVNPEELKHYGIDRYEKIIEKSPFAFKIVKEEGPPPVSFAADLSLSGFTIDSGKGITYASIVDKKQNTRFVINTLTPNKEGIQLVQVNRGPTLLETTVLARKDKEEATIAAEKAIVERKATVNVAAAGGGRQGQPNVNVNLNINPNANRANNVQNQINAQLQGQQGGNAGNQGLQPPIPQGQAQAPPGVVLQNNNAGGAPMTAGDLAAQANNPTPLPTAQPANNQQGGNNAGAPRRRRVILPPSAGN